MKCFIIFAVTLVLSVQAESTVNQSDLETVDDESGAASQEKKQEKRGIGYSTLGGYSGVSGLGADGTQGYYSGVGGYNKPIGVAGYDGGVGVGGYIGGLYSPYTPPRVAGLGSISGYTNPGYYNNGYNTGYSGYNGGYNAGYNGGYGGYAGAGYPGAYNSRLGSPYYRKSFYNSYPSSYYNNNLGSSIVGGGLGLGGVPPTVPVVATGGYQYGPGIFGGLYE